MKHQYSTYRDRHGRKVSRLLDDDEEPMTWADLAWLIGGVAGCLITAGVAIYVYAF